MQSLTVSDIICHIDRSFVNADMNLSKIPQDLIDLYGTSGKKQRHLLSNLFAISAVTSLHIASWDSASLVAAFHANRVTGLVINQKLESPVDGYKPTLVKYLQDRADLCVLQGEAAQFDIDEVREHGLFDLVSYESADFYERGDHAQTLCHLATTFQDRCLLLVDHWNSATVRASILQGIEQAELHLVYLRSVLSSDAEDAYGTKLAAIEEYWNGVAVMLLCRKHKAPQNHLAIPALPLQCVLVVARYNEDISWTDCIERAFIYNKGDETATKHEQVLLQNTGRESDTYLRHILQHYDHTSQFLLFTQGWPFDHCVKLDISKPATDFCIVGRRLNENFATPGNHPDLGPLLVKFWNELFDEPVPSTITFGCGAMFKVSAVRIRSRSKAFYEKVLELHKQSPAAPYALERLWPVIFGEAKSKL